MTIEDKVIANLKYAIRWNDKPTQKSMEVAIASLEAWEKVKAEIDAYLVAEEFGTAYRQDIRAIIDRHLQEASPTEAESEE